VVKNFFDLPQVVTIYTSMSLPVVVSNDNQASALQRALASFATFEHKLDLLLSAANRPAPRLLTVPEVSAMYRIGWREVRRLIDAGELKAATRKPRRGVVRYVIDAKHAEQVLGAR
jgi:hypothetical protein